MNKTKPKTIKNPTNHDLNIEFALHGFGFFGINQYNIMLFFWVIDVIKLPTTLANAFFSNNASWGSAIYSHTNNYWLMQSKIPSLDYVGLLFIVTAISHPYFIKQSLKKISFLEFEISRSFSDIRSIVFAIFIALLSSRLVDLLVNILQIAFHIKEPSFIVIR